MKVTQNERRKKTNDIIGWLIVIKCCFCCFFFAAIIFAFIYLLFSGVIAKLFIIRIRCRSYGLGRNKCSGIRRWKYVKKNLFEKFEKLIVLASIHVLPTLPLTCQQLEHSAARDRISVKNARRQPGKQRVIICLKFNSKILKIWPIFSWVHFGKQMTVPAIHLAAIWIYSVRWQHVSCVLHINSS